MTENRILDFTDRTSPDVNCPKHREGCHLLCLYKVKKLYLSLCLASRPGRFTPRERAPETTGYEAGWTTELCIKYNYSMASEDRRTQQKTTNRNVTKECSVAVA